MNEPSFCLLSALAADCDELERFVEVMCVGDMSSSLTSGSLNFTQTIFLYSIGES
jgi:hypothetical protein